MQAAHPEICNTDMRFSWFPLLYQPPPQKSQLQYSQFIDLFKGSKSYAVCQERKLILAYKGGKISSCCHVA